MHLDDSINSLPFRVSVLVFIKNKEGKFILLKRRKPPNKGCWTPIGGKLEMAEGESPFQCAIREVHEEAAFEVSAQDLHLFAMISEKSYENQNHWLLFLFECHKLIEHSPKPISEGDLNFFTRDGIKDLLLPQSDHKILWPIYDQYHKDFVALRADCRAEGGMEFVLEGSLSVLQSKHLLPKLK